MGNEVGLSYGMEKIATSAPRHPLGTLGCLPDGRKFRYAFSGQAIGAGQVVMQAAGVAAHDMDLTVAVAGVVGDASIVVDIITTNVTADQYADGYVYINDAGGEGHLYRLRSKKVDAGSAHAAVTAGNEGTFNFADGETLREATVVDTSLAGLMTNPYKDAEIWDADDIDGPCLGVAPAEVANDRYFWCQTSGFAAVLMDATAFVLGTAVEPSTTVDGAATLHDVSANTDRQSIGTIGLIVAVSTDYGIVKLTIE